MPFAMCGPGGNFAGSPRLRYVFLRGGREGTRFVSMRRPAPIMARGKQTRRQLSLSSQPRAMGHSAAGQPEGRRVSRTGTHKELPPADLALALGAGEEALVNALRSFQRLAFENPFSEKHKRGRLWKQGTFNTDPEQMAEALTAPFLSTSALDAPTKPVHVPPHRSALRAARARLSTCGCGGCRPSFRSAA